MRIARMSRAAAAVAAVVATAGIGATISAPEASASPFNIRVWAKGSTVFASANNLPPGYKECVLVVRPATWDVLGTYLLPSFSSPKFPSERSTTRSSVVVANGPSAPGLHPVAFNCLHRAGGKWNALFNVDRWVTV